MTMTCCDGPRLCRRSGCGAAGTTAAAINARNSRRVVIFRLRTSGFVLPARCDVRAVDVGDRRRSAVPHRQLQFALQDLEHAIDAGLSERAEAPQERASNPDRLRTERERL